VGAAGGVEGGVDAGRVLTAFFGAAFPVEVRRVDVAGLAVVAPLVAVPADCDADVDREEVVRRAAGLAAVLAGFLAAGFLAAGFFAAVEVAADLAVAAFGAAGFAVAGFGGAGFAGVDADGTVVVAALAVDGFRVAVLRVAGFRTAGFLAAGFRTAGLVDAGVAAAAGAATGAAGAVLAAARVIRALADRRAGARRRLVVVDFAAVEAVRVAGVRTGATAWLAWAAADPTLRAAPEAAPDTVSAADPAADAARAAIRAASPATSVSASDTWRRRLATCFRPLVPRAAASWRIRLVSVFRADASRFSSLCSSLAALLDSGLTAPAASTTTSETVSMTTPVRLLFAPTPSSPLAIDRPPFSGARPERRRRVDRRRQRTQDGKSATPSTVEPDR
jgi:hypothetical protein